MLAVSTMFPQNSVHPPVVLIHGAANSALVWTFWQRELAARGWASHAIDLRGHGRSEPIDLSRTSMHDYAADVTTVVAQLSRKPIVIGWSTGGLVALLVAESGLAKACVGLAPSRPARQIDTSVIPRTGEFGGEEYGIVNDDPEEQPEMSDVDREERMIALASMSRESRLARDERRRRIPVQALLCPLLIVTGTSFYQVTRLANRALAEKLKALACQAGT
ncbi:MAG TPA: alpha/beta fold hydrolase, partial [Chloroflexota bacterium]|nr:alpha/beta fold hydrolase [Chloroflexota bacterium]